MNSDKTINNKYKKKLVKITTDERLGQCQHSSINKPMQLPGMFQLSSITEVEQKLNRTRQLTIV